MIISVVLCLILSLVAVIPCFFHNDINLPSRNIDVDSIGTLSYTEKVEKLLSNFSSYSATTEGNVACFEAEVELDFNSISQLSFASTTDTPITKKYSTRLDMENEKFYILTQYIQDGIVINNEEIETEPLYEEYEDDYYILMPDGSKSSVKDLLKQDNLDECIAVTATVGSVAVLLLAATVVVMAPTIAKTVETVITKVVSWVRSFFSWFKSLFTKKTTYVTTTTVVTTLTPSISVAGKKIETKSVTKDEAKKLKPNTYYLCFADPTNGKMYVSIAPIEYNVALMIMSTPILVPCIGNDKKDMIASVFTINQLTALNLASAAGIASTIPEKHDADYYFHYHSIAVAMTRQKTQARPHAFFISINL